jgi:hypothetical protein
MDAAEESRKPGPAATDDPAFPEKEKRRCLVGLLLRWQGC